MLPRIGPRPGCVTMSTNVMPAPWFSAANMPLEKRIDRICDFGGSLPPRKPSTRIVRAGPRHLLQHLLHLVGIVGQRVDLILREHVAEPIALRIGRARRRIAADRDALVDLLDRAASPRAGCRRRGRGRPAIDCASRSRGTPTSTAYRPGARLDGDRDPLAVGQRRRRARSPGWLARRPLTARRAPGITAPLGSCRRPRCSAAPSGAAPARAAAAGTSTRARSAAATTR